MTAMNIADELVERICGVQHDAYEAAATRAGWETQAASRKPWAEVPEANKTTMRVSVRAALEAAAPLIAAEAFAFARHEVKADLQSRWESVQYEDGVMGMNWAAYREGFEAAAEYADDLLGREVKRLQPTGEPNG